ncbi:MAG: GNAT family N-acetyltransferase [Acidobacteria bacterium]|nr:GNAT family N-acetyltransferase [Acidobacteriota bacterium]
MFADAALAARIDRAEARMCAHIAGSIGAGRPEPAPLVLPISGGHAVYVAPLSPVNKVIGLGLDADLDLAALARIEREWRDRGEPLRIEMSVLADPSLGSALTDRGYRLHGFENVLGLPLDRTLPGPDISAVAVEIVTAGECPTWIDIAVDAFMNLDGTGSVPPDALPRERLRAVLEQMMGVPGFIRYLARMEGEAVGQAAMRIDGDLAQIAGAGTLPRARGRGVQKALLHRRLADARAAGCTLAVVTTAPGTRSQDNVMRRGFELLYARAILVKP